MSSALPYFGGWGSIMEFMSPHENPLAFVSKSISANVTSPDAKADFQTRQARHARPMSRQEYLIKTSARLRRVITASPAVGRERLLAVGTSQTGEVRYITSRMADDTTAEVLERMLGINNMYGFDDFDTPGFSIVTCAGALVDFHAPSRSWDTAEFWVSSIAGSAPADTVFDVTTQRLYLKVAADELRSRLYAVGNKNNVEEATALAKQDLYPLNGECVVKGLPHANAATLSAVFAHTRGAACMVSEDYHISQTLRVFVAWRRRDAIRALYMTFPDRQAAIDRFVVIDANPTMSYGSSALNADDYAFLQSAFAPDAAGGRAAVARSRRMHASSRPN